MKILKKLLIVIWAILTFGLFLYAQSLNTQCEFQKRENEKTNEIVEELSQGMVEYYKNMDLLRNDSLNLIDVDSLFENSLYLGKYEEKK